MTIAGFRVLNIRSPFIVTLVRGKHRTMSPIDPPSLVMKDKKGDGRKRQTARPFLDFIGVCGCVCGVGVKEGGGW